MAKKLQGALPPRGRYDWDKWLDGSLWELTPGEDFDRGVAGMRATAYQAATARGKQIRTSIRNGVLLIQAVES